MMATAFRNNCKYPTNSHATGHNVIFGHGPAGSLEVNPV